MDWTGVPVVSIDKNSDPKSWKHKIGRATRCNVSMKPKAYAHSVKRTPQHQLRHRALLAPSSEMAPRFGANPFLHK